MKHHKTATSAIIGISLALASCSGDTSTDDDTATRKRSSDKSEARPTSTKPVSTTETDGEDSSPTEPKNDDNAAKTSRDGQVALEDLPAKCKGFEVVGLKYSPGGTTLPNTCAPFDGLRNNPYAIRCIDADPDYKTNYAGDEYCILPPPPELGTQVHVGPEDYADPGMFELPPGFEETRTFYINASTEEDQYFYRTNTRLRRGGHHLVVSATDTDREDGWGIASSSSAAGFSGGAPGSAGGTPASPQGGSSSNLFSDLAGVSSGNFGVTQRVDQDRPQGTLEVPPENAGLGGVLKAKQQMSFNLHYINISDEPSIREVWLNIWYKDEKEVTTKLQPLDMGAGVNDVAVGAKQHVMLTYKCNVAEDARIISLYGHRHAQTDRFSIWVKKASGETFTAYESFSWEDMPTYQFDSISTNPTPNVDMKIDGASSGELTLSKGDELYFMCDITNKLDVPLRYGNETIDGEMCIVFGSYTGAEKPCRGGPQRIDNK